MSAKVNLELSKKEKKKLYNQNYLKKLKEKAINEHVEKESEEVPEVPKDFFFSKKQTAQIQPVQQIIPQVPTLKQKVIETLVLSSISLVPMILKTIIQRVQALNHTSEQQSEQPQQESPNTSQNYCPSMSLL